MQSPKDASENSTKADPSIARVGGTSAKHAREFDDSGVPNRLPVEEWESRLRELRRLEDGSEATEERLAGLFERLVHFTRPDGSAVFGAIGTDKVRLGRMVGEALRARNPAYATVVARWSDAETLKDAAFQAPPLPACSDATKVLAMLRPDWSGNGDWIGADHRTPGGVTRLELTGQGVTWISGDWAASTPQDVGGRAKPSAWSTGAFADCLEWSFRVGPTRVVRTLVLLRYRGMALIAQQEDGPAIPGGFRLPIADRVKVAPVADLRAWSLAAKKKTARLVPIGLPASPYPTEKGAFTIDDDHAVLTGATAQCRRWLPVLASWTGGPTSWRTLTVTEKSKICPPDVAFAARVAWPGGRDGLFIYRSLSRPALRVVLGHQTRARFLVGGFNAEGRVVPYLTLD